MQMIQLCSLQSNPHEDNIVNKHVFSSQTACPPGYWGVDCVELCKCRNASVACDAETGCVACDVGWTGGACDVDRDECRLDGDVCGANATCENVVGAYKCRCDAGFYRVNDECRRTYRRVTQRVSSPIRHRV